MIPIYSPKGRAGEYGELALNIYTGCNHGCVYCYARRMAERWGKDFSYVEPRAGIVEATKRQLEKESIVGKLIHLCFTCDPYPADIDTTPTREIIKAIKDSGNHVQILTKGGFRAERDFDLLDGNDWFGVTVAGNGTVTLENEPNAAPLYERILAIETAYEKGIKTWVSFEPVYTPQEVYDLIIYPWFIDLYKIGKLNYAPSDIDGSAFGHKCERLCKEHNRNYYIKEDLRAEMSK